MTFAIRNLSVLAYANGFTLWHYRAPKDKLREVGSNNYFGDACNMAAAGDFIMVTATDGARILVVASTDVQTVVTAPLS